MYPNLKKRESVLVVGVGALGCAAARLLAAASIAELTLVDPDRVELSNLQRQVLFGDDDIGALKVESAASALARGGAPRTRIHRLAQRLDSGNARELIAAHDFVVDACDDPATKFLINRTAVAAGTPYCHGGVMRTGGQWMTVAPGVSACLACVFPDEDAAESDAGCSAMGILAPVAGVVGAMQGLAAVDFLRDPRRVQPGRLYTYELRGRRRHSVYFPPRASCRCCAQRAATPTGVPGPPDRRAETSATQR